MFIPEVVAVNADDSYYNEGGAFKLRDAEPLCYVHGKY